MVTNINTVFMDYDGTLHDSIKIYSPAFKEAFKYLVDNGYTQEREWSENEIAHWLGFNKNEMWKSFMPYLDNSIVEKASEIISENMSKHLKDGKAQLYQGALEILDYLKSKGYNLIFISNCGTYYKDMAKELFKLDRYFSEMICAEDFNFIPKHEIIKKIKNNYQKEFLLIGDKQQDFEAGKENNIYTIGCEYGYGSKEELKQADYLIRKVTDIKHIL